MDWETFWIFIGCAVFLAISIIGAVLYYRRVKSWNGCPTTEEYMKSLFLGWASWLGIIIAGCCTLFMLPFVVRDVINLVIDVLK